jgi:hypothetical protein
MKINSIIFSCIVVFNNCLFAQEKRDDDKWARAAVALNYDHSLPDFKTSMGKAAAKILLKTHAELLPYPEIRNIPEEDKNMYNELYKKLEGLRAHPPSWEELVKLEEAKNNIESAPPTPPVYAGDEAAKKFKSGKNSTKLSQSVKATNKH